jgi:formiminotetrahydrofolate cyclodeaminase
MVDRDTDAFDMLMAAYRLSRADTTRADAIREATLEATRVPLQVLEDCVETLDLAFQAAAHGNPNAVTDAGVAGLVAHAAAEGASLNVRINLSSIEGHADLERRRADALERCRTLAASIAQTVESRLPPRSGVS